MHGGGASGGNASSNNAEGSETHGEARAANAASHPTSTSAGAGTGASSGADASAGNKRGGKSAPAETRRTARNPFPDDLYRSTEKGPSRITLRCKILQEEYRLTSRETEIMELIVRGYSVARIAEEHVVSENTVRTHYKHIYAKLGIHKKQELIAMVDALKDTI